MRQKFFVCKIEKEALLWAFYLAQFFCSGSNAIFFRDSRVVLKHVNAMLTAPPPCLANIEQAGELHSTEQIRPQSHCTRHFIFSNPPFQWAVCQVTRVVLWSNLLALWHSRALHAMAETHSRLSKFPRVSECGVFWLSNLLNVAVPFVFALVVAFVFCPQGGRLIFVQTTHHLHRIPYASDQHIHNERITTRSSKATNVPLSTRHLVYCSACFQTPHTFLSSS